MKELFFIGDYFYHKSYTIMSSLYENGTNKRWDWSEVGRNLRNGETITIRPATDAEISCALAKLNIIDLVNWKRINEGE